MGLLQVVLGNAYYLALIQFLIEYFLAFAFVGLAGLFYKTIQTHFQAGKKKKALLWVVIATLVGSVARYFWHFVAGVVFWGEYAPEGMSPVIYSLIVNGVTMIGAFVLCSAVLVLLLTKGSRIIRQNKLIGIEETRVLAVSHLFFRCKFLQTLYREIRSLLFQSYKNRFCNYFI